MSNKRAPGRSLDEWMELVTECRQSGLTDAAWCNEHGISPSCFYNAVTRLRKKACQIPDPVGKASTLDLTSHKQDVVQIAIEPESSQMCIRDSHMDPRRSALYLFCGKRCDRIKALLWESDGFVLLYKRMEVQGRFRWPRNQLEVKQLTWQQFDWLTVSYTHLAPYSFGRFVVPHFWRSILH